MSNTTKQMQLTVQSDVEKIDRSLPTASWWDRLTIKAGAYMADIPVEDSHAQAYFALSAIVEESYRVERLFTASSSSTEFPKTAKTHGYQATAHFLAQTRGIHLGDNGVAWIGEAGAPVPAEADIRALLDDLAGERQAAMAACGRDWDARYTVARDLDATDLVRFAQLADKAARVTA